MASFRLTATDSVISCARALDARVTTRTIATATPRSMYMSLSWDLLGFDSSPADMAYQIQRRAVNRSGHRVEAGEDVGLVSVADDPARFRARSGALVRQA